MIKQILSINASNRGESFTMYGLSDNGEIYEMIDGKWSHICSSPDDTKKPYFDGEWKIRNS